MADHPSDAIIWYPKPFTPGDMQGDGAQRLLGAHALSRHALLVRETAQNSWDARLGGRPLHWSVDGRSMDSKSLDALRHLLTGASTGLGLRELLAGDEVWILEISDRGSVGLDGPVRNDNTVPEGVSKNFIDFVFNLGAPADDKAGGGTYGFGKTASYAASDVGTVVIWSRCLHDGELEHRLIASAIGPAFDRNGRRHTGRHWWGTPGPSEHMPIAPLLGDAARHMGEQLFGRGFSGEETGTSLMILDPSLAPRTGPTTAADVEELVVRMRDAAFWNLWPKLVPEADRDTMQMSFSVAGHELEVPNPARHPALQDHVRCLQAVRATQAGHATQDDGFPIDVIEVRCGRPKRLLGHLALTKAPVLQQVERGDEGFETPADNVALMRSTAELVVKYLNGPSLDLDGIQWAGVFKPVAELDPVYARAEPPAHDAWESGGLERPESTYVNVTQRSIRDRIRSFTRDRPGDATTEVGHGAVVVADALADLVGSALGNAPGMRPSSARGSGSSRPRVRVTDQRRLTVGGDDVVALEIVVEWDRGGDVDVVARVDVATESGSVAGGWTGREIGWMRGHPDEWSGAAETGVQRVAVDERRWFAVALTDDEFALDVQFEASQAARS